MNVATPGTILVISGPSGSGKTSIVKRLLKDQRTVFSVSATTRPPREGEVDGVHYHFLSPEEFRTRSEQGEFVEWAEVHGNLYGTLVRPMDDAVLAGKVYVVEIDVQGALQLKELGVLGAYVFIAPPRMENLRERLEGRGTDAPEVIERRIKKAHDEMEERHRYDYIVINDDLDRAVVEVQGIVGLDPTQEV